MGGRIIGQLTVFGCLNFSVDCFLQLGTAETGVWKLLVIVDIFLDVICV